MVALVVAAAAIQVLQELGQLVKASLVVRLHSQVMVVEVVPAALVETADLQIL
jgi:CheY-specific phosphatase CheX